MLAWLLDESSGAFVRESLASEPIVLASDLTLIECDRVLHRAKVLGELTEAEAADRRAHLATVAASWASLLVARSAIAGLALLSLDSRVRTAASHLGIELHPRDVNALTG